MLSMSEKKRKRHEMILSSFTKLKFATRKQLQLLHDLGSDRNALRILRELKDYLHVKTYDGMNVYYLAPLGREIVGIEEEVKWNQNVGHHLMRNDLYLYLRLPESWEVERKVEFKYKSGLTYQELSLVPDARFLEKNIRYFVEVDHTQSMIVNKKKIEMYYYLSQALQQESVLIFYTLTELRREKLSSLCREYNLIHKIYTKEDTR